MWSSRTSVHAMPLLLRWPTIRRWYGWAEAFISTVGGLMIVTAALPSNTGWTALDALIVFCTWYPMGVMLMIFASWPLVRMIEERRKRGP